ncbi:hypothetical protein H2248_006836 [Termitomyces sp. 'cryptogamus']|nr:hypothetical protein H2248_006836 [Termitomyces sp. 'cryptogamus']
MSYVSDDEIVPGDIVAVRHGLKGRQEGLVIGAHVDYMGRQVIEVQLDSTEVYQVYHPYVTRLRRTISYSRPSLSAPHKVRTVERRVLW